jgi:hypothetical protein
MALRLLYRYLKSILINLNNYINITTDIVKIKAVIEAKKAVIKV